VLHVPKWPGSKARFMATTEITGASLFNQTKRWKTVKPQKSRHADANLLWSSWPSPFAERSVGTNGENHRITFTRRFDTQRLLSEKRPRMGDKAKPLASQRPAALLSECPETVRLPGTSR